MGLRGSSGGGGGSQSISRARLTISETTKRFFALIGQVGTQTVESRGQSLILAAGIITRLVMNVTSNTRVAPDAEYRLRVEGADSGLTLDVGAGLDGDFIDTGSIAVAADDKIAATSEAGAGAGLIDSSSIGVLFIPT